MSELVEWMKDIYLRARENRFEWKPVHPNNLTGNPVEGIYTDMNFKKDGKYDYLKYTISFESRCDENGTSHPEEGTKYYVLHELYLKGLDEEIRIPEPCDRFNPANAGNAALVDNYGRYRHVFDDEETAKKVVCSELLFKIYPCTYILSAEEEEDWYDFLSTFPDEGSCD